MGIWDRVCCEAVGASSGSGTQGPPGPPGPMGPAGETGPAGPEGPKGDTGDTGATGATGPEGPKGDTGATGPAGADGADGEPGPQGPVGPEGPQGPAGEGGVTSVNGNEGPAVVLTADDLNAAPKAGPWVNLTYDTGQFSAPTPPQYRVAGNRIWLRFRLERQDGQPWDQDQVLLTLPAPIIPSHPDFLIGFLTMDSAQAQTQAATLRMDVNTDGTIRVYDGRGMQGWLGTGDGYWLD